MWRMRGPLTCLRASSVARCRRSNDASGSMALIARASPSVPGSCGKKILGGSLRGSPWPPAPAPEDELTEFRDPRVAALAVLPKRGLANIRGALLLGWG